MPRKGDVVYANATLVLEPVRIREIQNVERQVPDGEMFSDSILKVQWQDGTMQEDYAASFTQVPFLTEIEQVLETSELVKSKTG